jgi:hypothetical protein
MRRVLAAALVLYVALAAPHGHTAELSNGTEVRLLAGDEAKALIQADFIRFDPSYLDHQTSFGDRLARLGKRLSDLQAAGHDLECSNEIYLEAKWLQRYTTYWDELEQRLNDLEKSLDDLDQDSAIQQSADTGLWGPCYHRSFFKLEATMLALIELHSLGEAPKFPIRMPPPFETFASAFIHFRSLLVSDIARTGVDNRGELGNLSTVGSLAYFKAYLQDYLGEIIGLPRNKDESKVTAHENSEAFSKFVEAWQDPVSGYWGAWYSSGGRLYKTADLSFTFHIISYRRGDIDHWPAITETTLAIENEPYPYGWRHEGQFTNHNNYDVAKIFRYGWPHMTPQQRQRAATEIDEMLHWTLTSSLQRDGSFKTVPSFFSSIGADFYFGVSFLQTIGFWDRKDRFWTERDFPEAPAICRQIKAQLKEMALKSHESEVALQRLSKTC